MSVTNQVIEASVLAAFAAYTAKHAERKAAGKTSPEFTVEQLRERITKSRNSVAAANNKANRLERKATVNALAAEPGVRFVIDREYEKMIVSSDREFLEFSGNDGRNMLFETITEERNEISPQGGKLVAYRLAVGDSPGMVHVEFTTAVCRNDESFDPLLGKEVALDKFKDPANRTVREFTPAVHNVVFD